MDLTFHNPEGAFNYRVCALLIHHGRLLVMKDSDISHYYLPGGRVRFGETAETAVARELEEELGIRCEKFRPLWLNQSFFAHDATGQHFHELCVYFLADFTGTDLLSRGDCFQRTEEGKIHEFSWMPFERLKNEYFYPLFLKEEIFHLPDALTLRTEVEPSF